jgi:hypothetical protein
MTRPGQSAVYVEETLTVYFRTDSGSQAASTPAVMTLLASAFTLVKALASRCPTWLSGPT